MSKSVESLYVHVPFCAHKCEYCAFYSHAPSDGIVDRYVASLVKELDRVRDRLKPRTIFFGGGTPSLLTLKQWRTILGAMEGRGLLGAEEWTVECNPATLSLDKARLLRSFGVNRISLGVQSFDPAMLDLLGRIHSPGMVYRSFDIVRQAGFDNVNLDLMFGIPGQSMAVWEATLAEAMRLEPEHLASYEVTYEEDTPLFHRYRAGEFSVDEELICDMYEALVDNTASRGYGLYEVSNFGRHRGTAPARIPDRACRHNLNYWRGGFFYGLGPSAAEFVDGTRSQNWASTEAYCSSIESGQRPLQSRDLLPPLARAGEIAGIGLRTSSGWEYDEFTSVTGFDLRREWAGEMERLRAEGLGEMGEEGFRLTRAGLRMADWAAELFLR